MPSPTILRAMLVLVVFSSAALQSPHWCLAQRQTEEPNAFTLTTAHVLPPGWTELGKQFYTGVEWEGRQYGTSEGIEVLMRVITDGGTGPAERANALKKLGGLWPWMRNSDRIRELMALYGTLTGHEEKRGVLACLTRCEDPRALPLLAQVLENEQDDLMRLGAARALAEWNVRRGVAEVIRIHDDCKDAASAHSHVCTAAANSLAWLNTHKAWGFADGEVRDRLLGRTDLNDDQRRELYLNEITNWWRHNERRFPDWKPGDPLPAGEPPPGIPPIPGPEDVLPLSAASLQPPEYARVGKDQAYWRVGQEKDEEISWEGRHYEGTEAVDLLMKVAVEPGAVADRFFAIERLGRLASQLRNTDHIPELKKVYARLSDRSEKTTLLFCLAESKDQRALPLFAEVLGTREEEHLRLPAAYGLALWNVRRGVRELIELLSAKQTESPIRYPGIIGVEAARLLFRLNYWKSWWTPEVALQAAIEAGAETRDEVLRSSYEELKKWWAENEHRFPDWNPGDPLPEIEEARDSEAPDPSDE